MRATRTLAGFLVIGLASACIFNASSDCLQLTQDCEALCTFYQGANGTSWTNSHGWGNASLCGATAWFGVTCVLWKPTELQLSKNGLLGTVSPSLASVTTLQQIAMAENSLSGVIPTTLSSLTALELLELAGNSISGDIPAEFSSHSTLRFLAVSSNHISGTLAAGLGFPAMHKTNPKWASRKTDSFLVSLVTGLALASSDPTTALPPGTSDMLAILLAFRQYNLLDFSGNDMSGTIPPELLASHCGLNMLVVHGNAKLSGTIPDSLSGCTELAVLMLNPTAAISGTLPAGLGALSELQVLTFGASISGAYQERQLKAGSLSQLSGTLPDGVFALPDLKMLDISGVAKLSGTIGSTFSPQVYYCSLYDFPYLYGDLSTALATASNLVYMRVQNREFVDKGVTSGTIPATMPSPLLWELNLQNIALSGTIPSTLPVTMGQLYLTRTGISGTIPRSLAAISFLEASRTGLSGVIPDTFASLTTLRTLRLRNCALSGTLPSSLRLLTAIRHWDVGANAISGEVSPGLASLTSLTSFVCSSTRLSGTIPSSLGQFSVLAAIEFADTRVSGTIPDLSGSPSLVLVNLYRLRLSGTVSDMFSGLNRMSVLSLTKNSISGTLPSSIGALTRLEVLTANKQALSGTMPTFLSSLTGLILLDLSELELSGTLPDSFPTSLETLDLSRNRLSGSLPEHLFASANMTTVLVNSNLFSGSLPHLSKNDLLSTLAVARNFLEGDTTNLKHGAGLRTLILSGNYLSCKAVDLEEATQLAQGTFLDPVPLELFQAGDRLYRTRVFFDNPYADAVPDQYPNIALSFAGNPQLSTDAAYIPDKEATRLRAKDSIQKGRRYTFPGYHSLWQILFVTIPVLGALHGIVVVFVVREQKGDKTLSGALKAYFCPSLTGMHINPHIHTLGKSMKVMQALAGLGLCLVVLVAATPGVWACFDPLVGTTVAPVRTGTAFQWIWVLFNVTLMSSLVFLCEVLSSGHLKEQAMRVHSCLCSLSDLAVYSPVVQAWHQNTIHDPNASGTRWRLPKRKIVAYGLHAPLLVVASAPAFGYVLARNVPAGSGFEYTLMGNSLLLAVIKLGFNWVVVPRAADWLSRLRHRVSGIRAASITTINVYKSQVGTAMLFEVFTVLLAPMFGVFLLDESCLRYYLGFADSLHSVLTNWSIGDTGAGAYRTQVCSRQLISEFTYVWLSVMLINAFVPPVLRLVQSSEKFQAGQQWLRTSSAIAEDLLREADPHQQTLDRAERLRDELSDTFSSMLTFFVFGILVPHLLLLAPLVCWLNLCSLQWEAQHRTQVHFGEVLAHRVLVHPPIGLFRNFAFAGNWMATVFLFVDLEFNIGPVVFWALLNLFLVLMSRCVSWDGQRLRWRGPFARKSSDTSEQAAPVSFETNPVSECKIDASEHAAPVSFETNPVSECKIDVAPAPRRHSRREKLFSTIRARDVESGQATTLGLKHDTGADKTVSHGHSNGAKIANNSDKQQKRHMRSSTSRGAHGRQPSPKHKSKHGSPSREETKLSAARMGLFLDGDPGHEMCKSPRQPRHSKHHKKARPKAPQEVPMGSMGMGDPTITI